MDIKFLKGVGEKRAEAFRKIGIDSLEDFLTFIPRIHIKRVKIADARRMLGENIIVYGRVLSVTRPSRPSHPVTVELEDGTGSIEIPIFGGSEFRAKQFRLDEDYVFYGKVSEAFKGYTTRLDYRDHLRINLTDETDRDFLKYSFVPIYELSGILKATWIKPLTLSKIVFNAFRYVIKSSPGVPEDTLPASVINDNVLYSKKDAVLRINFPINFEQIETARKRLAFEELFYLQLLLALKRKNLKDEIKGISFETDIKQIAGNFIKVLKFDLTKAQKRVINEIYSDMKSEKVMNRLLQGDVGSGKTIVSVFGMLIALKCGSQSAFMCPTEILAEQHFNTISEFIGKYNKVAGTDYSVTLLVGGQKKKLRNEILGNIKSGMSNIIIGTHALIQESVSFANLGFVVIDEQHKFGVMQRAKIKDKGLNPDVLVMTATPIPRTLSLTYYGDLDVSVIDELPANRKKVITSLVKDTAKFETWSFVKDKLGKGSRAFIIYPIIDESEKLDLKSAEENFLNHKNINFKNFNVGMVHGRMPWYEIEETMNDFKSGKLDVLVATTVIEVGIDIPEANVMIIEEAQRFGLSQLHQLRGRVGRGADQSYCIMIAKYLDEISKKRLDTLCRTTDGFEIAEVDMEIRGPGEFYGIRQSGVLNFSVTDLAKDNDILEKARKTAFNIVDRDPHLRMHEHEMIRKELLKKYKDSMYLMNIA
ncbi:MAG: ATP-dependent DNA helicase RecG [Ignavibacteria bacterium]|nr:ATP-dependent DNA helicase RecG [Ignavibacteria bacterium]